MSYALDLFRNSICLLKPPFWSQAPRSSSANLCKLASSLRPGQLRWPWRLASKSSIFSGKASYARGLLTHALILVCVILFFWNGVQEMRNEGPFTPIERAMLFDTSITWRGVYDGELPSQAPLFEKIRQGEIYRLITPIFLHRGLLHLLFNMSWLWMLGRQIEERIGKWRLTLLILISASISNVLQYLMSGPFFMGFSGVVVGLAGFIWMRQRRAPCEGYPLPRSTAHFIAIFVASMFALELLSYSLELFSLPSFSAQIANTAHIAGGCTGIALAAPPYFARRA